MSLWCTAACVLEAIATRPGGCCARIQYWLKITQYEVRFVAGLMKHVSKIALVSRVWYERWNRGVGEEAARMRPQARQICASLDSPAPLPTPMCIIKHPIGTIFHAIEQYFTHHNSVNYIVSLILYKLNWYIVALVSFYLYVVMKIGIIHIISYVFYAENNKNLVKVLSILILRLYK